MHGSGQHLKLECTAAEGEGIGPFSAATPPGFQQLHGTVVARKPAGRCDRMSAEAPSSSVLMPLQFFCVLIQVPEIEDPVARIDDSSSC